MNGEAAAQSVPANLYAGKDRQQLADILFKAGGKAEEIPDAEAFQAAWKTAALSPDIPSELGKNPDIPLPEHFPTWGWIDPNNHSLVLRENIRVKQQVKDPLCCTFAQSDLGNSQRLATRFGVVLRYCKPFKSWFFWDGRRWARDDRGFAIELAKDTVDRIADEASVAGGADRGTLHKWCGTSQGRPRIEGLLFLSQSALAVTPQDLDRDPFLFNCRNGTLDLATLIFRGHQQGDLLTRMAAVDFDPAATCPTWEKFLDRIMDGNADLIGYLQRAAGYSLTGHTGERALFLCHGRGANGKSTFLNTLLAVIGEYGISVESSTFCISRSDKVRNDLAALKGARLVTSTEAGRGRRLDEEIVKLLTGGEDKIRARFLFQEAFEFKPECKIWWSFNSAPRITDATDSIWSRVRLIPFSIVIPEAERDIRLPEKLMKEAPGILNWMLAGLREYRRIGLAEPEEVRAATQEYREEQDDLADFFNDMCTIEPGASCGATDLYNEYAKWHAWQAPEEKTKSQRAFGFEMNDHGFKRDRDEATRKKIYSGIRLKKGGF